MGSIFDMKESYVLAKFAHKALTPIRRFLTTPFYVAIVL